MMHEEVSYGGVYGRRVRKGDGEMIIADVKLQEIIFHVHATLT